MNKDGRVEAERRAHSRVPINIDPIIRDVLRQHLMTNYAGTGVGFSEWIRRALTWDMARDVPLVVQPDMRWSGTFFPGPDHTNGPNCEMESEQAQHVALSLALSGSHKEDI